MTRKLEKAPRFQPAAVVSFTFDDGFLSTYTHAFPVLRDLGLVGHLAVVTDLVGTPGHYTWEQIAEMVEAGWEVESHTCSHDFSELNPEKLQREVVESKAILESHGLAVQVFSFPGGPWQDNPVFAPGGPFEQLVRRTYSGYLPIHNRMPHPMRPPVDPFRLSWQTGECLRSDQWAAPIEAIRACLDEAVAAGAWCNSLWHDVTVSNGKHWPKFRLAADYAAAHVRAGRMRSVTSSAYLELNEKQGMGSL